MCAVYLTKSMTVNTSCYEKFHLHFRYNQLYNYYIICCFANNTYYLISIKGICMEGACILQSLVVFKLQIRVALQVVGNTHTPCDILNYKYGLLYRSLAAHTILGDILNYKYGLLYRSLATHTILGDILNYKYGLFYMSLPTRTILGDILIYGLLYRSLATQRLEPMDTVSAAASRSDTSLPG